MIMSYPENGAQYKHKPAWLGRALEGEKHASGGRVEADWRGSRYEKDHATAGRRVYEPMGEDTGMAAAATKDHGYTGRKRGGAVKKRADGGPIEGMASPDMKPTDPTISLDDVKTWGTPDNARAAARARENAQNQPAMQQTDYNNHLMGMNTPIEDLKRNRR